MMHQNQDPLAMYHNSGYFRTLCIECTCEKSTSSSKVFFNPLFLCPESANYGCFEECRVRLVTDARSSKCRRMFIEKYYF